MEPDVHSSVLLCTKIHHPNNPTEEPYSASLAFNYEVCKQSQHSRKMNVGSVHDLELNGPAEAGRAPTGIHMTSVIVEGHPHRG